MPIDLSEYCSILIYGRPGSGKSNFIKYFLKKIPYKHLLVISSTSYQYEGKYKNLQIMDVYDINTVDNFINKNGELKIIVFDDFLHLDFNGKTGQHLRHIISTLRHHKCFILAGTQLLNTIGKAFRLCSKIFMTAQLDEDSIKLLKIKTGFSNYELSRIHLDEYEFLIADNSGNLDKLKIHYEDDSPPEKSKSHKSKT